MGRILTELTGRVTVGVGRILTELMGRVTVCGGGAVIESALRSSEGDYPQLIKFAYLRRLIARLALFIALVR